MSTSQCNICYIWHLIRVRILYKVWAGSFDVDFMAEFRHRCWKYRSNCTCLIFLSLWKLKSFTIQFQWGFFLNNQFQFFMTAKCCFLLLAFRGLLSHGGERGLYLYGSKYKDLQKAWSSGQPPAHSSMPIQASQVPATPVWKDVIHWKLNLGSKGIFSHH